MRPVRGFFDEIVSCGYRKFEDGSKRCEMELASKADAQEILKFMP